MDDVGVSTDTAFRDIPPGVGFETVYFGTEKLGRLPLIDSLLLCSLPDLHLWNVQGTFSQMLYIPVSA